jgi:hypothetical protein
MQLGVRPKRGYVKPFERRITMCRKLAYLYSIVLVLGLVLPNAANGVAPVPNSGWWKLDEGSGTIARDSSGNGRHGSIEGAPTWTNPGWEGWGWCMQFGGDNDRITVESFELTGTGITLAAWIKPTSYKGDARIISKTEGGGTSEHYWCMLLGTSGNTSEDRIQLRLRTNDGSGATAAIAPAGAEIPLNEWTHVAVTWDASDPFMRLFSNGEETHSASKAGTAVATGPGLKIGIGNQSVSAGAGSTIRPFGGFIDDVRVYDYGLSADQLKELLVAVFPAIASSPSPANGAEDVPRDVVLSWTPGDYAPAVNGHIVYLNENFNDVNDGIGGTTHSASSYDPGRLNLGTTYFWRVDEVNAPPDSTVFKGETWSFTTEPVGYPIAGANITATASSTGQVDFGPEKTIDGSGLDENGLHSTEPLDMWISGDEPSGAWIQYEFGRMQKLHQMWVWNSNQIFEGLFGFGFKDVTVEYSTNGTDWMALAGVPQFAKAPGTAGYAHDTTVDFGGAVAKHVRLTASSNWGGILPQYGLSEVRFFSMPMIAREPSPDSGAADVDVDATLAWRAGREAATHDVYLSTDEQAVIDGTVPAVSATDASYSSALDLGSTYFWRVDEVNNAETLAIWQGDVWDFTTQEYIVVDDFEDYNDYPPYEVYSTWADGYEDPTNGSQAGNLTPPIMETGMVHGDAQSVPLFYTNTGGATHSEITRTFAVPQDWTKYGIQTLVLYFHGTSGNTGQLYVKINGTKIPYDGDAANLAVALWQPWNIDLTALGMNFQSVTTLAIGIDGNGAAGTLYIDDIRLYAYARQLITPVQPDPAGLVGHWAFDESAGIIAADSSGRGNDGTLVSDQFQWRPGQGRSGGALWCPGLLDSYVEFPTRDMSPAAGTVTLWGNLANPQPSQTRYFFGHTTIPPYGDRIQLYVDDSNTNLDLGLGGSHSRKTDIMTLELETWYHIALTWDGGNYVVYVNGQEAAAGTYTDLTQLNAVADIANDGNTTGRTEGFAGLLDEIRVYDRALSYAEIAGLAGRTQPFDESF